MSKPEEILSSKSKSISLQSVEEHRASSDRGLTPSESLRFSSQRENIPSVGGLKGLIQKDDVSFLSVYRRSTDPSFEISYRRDGNGMLVPTVSATPMVQEDSKFFADRESALVSALKNKQMEGKVNFNDEIGTIGGAWRGILRRLMLLQMDHITSLRLSRVIQLQMHLLSVHEAYILGNVVEALDHGKPKEIQAVLKVAFQNRNVSRVIVQAIGARFDWLWHDSTQFMNAKTFDAFGQIPIIGITSFPASENFPATRAHATNSILRLVLGQGNWLTRVVTGNRQGLVTDNPDNTAQNLAAESNGFELANRNQFGTYFGRMKTNEFRVNHRLPTDESVYRSFITSPTSTLLNNGVVHVLRVAANHWRNLLEQENFAHQRMEQLDPFELLRFHMVATLTTLANLRGRNNWDIEVLGPFIRRLQSLTPSSNVISARQLVQELQEKIVIDVSSGIASVVDPFKDWLEAIDESLVRIEAEAKAVYGLVTSVEWGIRIGYDILSAVNWEVPKDSALLDAIIKYIKKEDIGKVDKFAINRALNKMTPRDMRTLIELVTKGYQSSKPAQLLLGRAKTLLQRELRRDQLNDFIRRASVGDEVKKKDLAVGEWYWINEGVYALLSSSEDGSRCRFMHITSNTEKDFDLSSSTYKCHGYIPVAESITRAQKVFMLIEINYGRRFAYNAFMEFQYLRNHLNRLVSVSQMACSELDDARINFLKEIQRSRKEASIPLSEMKVGHTYYLYDKISDSYRSFVYEKGTKVEGKVLKSPPQSVLVVGGGPTGLLNVIHSLENCLATGGIMKLYEARDAFFKGGATFERAQIVRLDARWIAMMRYHLGTIFEDIYIPATGETNPQLGNTLPSQGFVEITIKNMEMMLHEELTRFWSNGLISIYSESKSEYDPVTNRVFKEGSALKLDDLVLRKVDNEGRSCDKEYTWFVKDVEYYPTLSVSDLLVGTSYGIWIREKKKILTFRLVSVNVETDEYIFRSETEGVEDRVVASEKLPSIYKAGTPSELHGSKVNIVFACQVPNRNGKIVKETVSAPSIARQKFDLDIGNTHIVRATGKPAHSKVHLHITTDEPYGVCCLQGLKVSLGMHNFGERRWKNGLVDDFRSQNDDNTRIIGDFTKMVQSAPIVQLMSETIHKNEEWALHFEKLVDDSHFPNMNAFHPVVPKIRAACQELASRATLFRRRTLQTRFFETGDNYYLGMEFNREFDAWKNALGDELVQPLRERPGMEDTKEIDKFRSLLLAHVDRLWYDSCLETIRKGDVYNPGARKRVPRLYLINSMLSTQLSSLSLYEAFRVRDDPELYEILDKDGSKFIVRSVEGYISTFNGKTEVYREGNLTRGPDGNEESKVAIASFDVHHGINYRTMRVTDFEKGYTAAFHGDEQSSPHFMRYSGLTGAGINAASFADFIGKARAGLPFIERFREYSQETNWSNGEVVLRGTAGQLGEDGFLRPGAPYIELVKYLHSKIVESLESDQGIEDMLSKDWKLKFAGALIPRGLEYSETFVEALRRKWQDTVLDFVISEYSLQSHSKQIWAHFNDSHKIGKAYEIAWSSFPPDLEIEENTVKIAERLDCLCSQIVSFAQQIFSNNARYSSQLSHQPKPVDTVSDDFAVEAQNFANSLTLAASFSAGALAFQLLGSGTATTISALLSAWNIFIAFGSMTNVARYKIRNEEARVEYKDHKLLPLKKELFSAMPEGSRKEYANDQNPYFESMKNAVDAAKSALQYYDMNSMESFIASTNALFADLGSAENIQRFQDLLLKDFIVDTYSVNSYVQESLVSVYRCTDELLRSYGTEKISGTDEKELKELFNHVNEFGYRLENSLQRGTVRWGFVKRRKFQHWDICAALHYLYSFLFVCQANKNSRGGVPIQIETLGLSRALNQASMNAASSTFLRRGIRDMEGLYWNTRESEIASLIFVLATLVFIASILFTIARIFALENLLDFAFWANTLSAFGAFLACFHFYRKGSILLNLWRLLSQTTVSTREYEDLEVIKIATYRQFLLTVLRFITGVAAMIALGISVAARTFDETYPEKLPAQFAAIAVCAAIGSVLFFFFVEYRIRYSLPTTLGAFVCELFRGEIEQIYDRMVINRNAFDPPGKQEREVWEYVAREFLHRYRFDTVFAADRFGQILQYIQSGMEQRTSTFF